LKLSIGVADPYLHLIGWRRGKERVWRSVWRL